MTFSLYIDENFSQGSYNMKSRCRDKRKTYWNLNQAVHVLTFNFAVYTSCFMGEQESPPAWTQEAYRPRRIKYHSVGYPPSQVWPGGGTRGGVPPARSDGGYLRWGTPFRVPPPVGVCPHLDLAGVSPPPPRLDLLGYPPPRWTDRMTDGQTRVKT